MPRQTHISRGVATVSLVGAAKRGDLPRMRALLKQGANPDCWVESGSVGRRMPLTTVAASIGSVSSARLLLEYITDETIRLSNMGDWRANYGLSPVAHFAGAGMEDITMQMLDHCQHTMTVGNWTDFLYYCVAGDSYSLIDDCVKRLEQPDINVVKNRVLRGHGMLPPAWDIVEAEMCGKELGKETISSGVGLRVMSRL